MQSTARHGGKGRTNHLKVFDHASTSPKRGGKANSSAFSLPCMISTNLIQCFIPDLKLATERGQLPNTAATRALALHCSRATASHGKLRSNISNATLGRAFVMFNSKV